MNNWQYGKLNRRVIQILRCIECKNEYHRSNDKANIGKSGYFGEFVMQMPEWLILLFSDWYIVVNFRVEYLIGGEVHNSR